MLFRILEDRCLLYCSRFQERRNLIKKMGVGKLTFILFWSRDRSITFIFFRSFTILFDIRYLARSIWYLFPSSELGSNFVCDTAELISFFDL